MRVQEAVRLLVTLSFSSVGALYLLYVSWRFMFASRKRSLPPTSESDDDESKPKLSSSESPSPFDTNVIRTVVRPVLTQVIASALQDKVTLNAFRNLCVSVLADGKVCSQFRTVINDVCASKEIAHSLALLVRNACSDDDAASGLSKVLAKTLNMLSEENREVGRQVLTRSLADKSVSSQLPAPDEVPTPERQTSGGDRSAKSCKTPPAASSSS